MAEKLTTQLDATNKKVEDISKSRLGSGFKNIIKLPGLTGSDETVEVTDAVTVTLSNISPTGYANEHIIDTQAEFQAATGNYVIAEFNFCVDTADVCNQWYYYDVPESMLNKNVVIKILNPPTSSVSYNDTKVGILGSSYYTASNGRNYSRLVKVARDINLDDLPAVNVIIRPTVAGRYFIGMQSPTNNTVSDTLTWSYGEIIMPYPWQSITRGGRFISDTGVYNAAYRQGVTLDIPAEYYANNTFFFSMKQVYVPSAISSGVNITLRFKHPSTGVECGTLTRSYAQGINGVAFVQSIYNPDTGVTTHNAWCYRIEVTGVSPENANRVLICIGDANLYNVIPADDTGAAYGKRFYFKGEYFISPLGAPTVTANGVSVTPVQKYGSIYTVSGTAPWVFDRPVMMMNASCLYDTHWVGHQLFDAEGSLEGTDFWVPLPKLGANVASSTSTIMVIPVAGESLSCTYTTSTGLNNTISIPSGGANINLTNSVGEMFARLTFTKSIKLMIQYFGGSGTGGGEFVLPVNLAIPNTRYTNYNTMQSKYLDMSARSNDDIVWENVYTLGSSYGNVGAVYWTAMTFPQTVDNLVCHVAMSTDGVNFGPWVGVYNGGNLPSLENATHVKVRLTSPLDVNISNNISQDDNWVSQIKILYYTYTQQ